MKKLTGPQRQQLHNALLIAFPDREALERLVSFGLNTQLIQISKGDTYSAVVLSMINYYENTIGQLEKLIEAARGTNSTNPELANFYEHIWQHLKSQVTTATSSHKQEGTQQQHNSAVKAKETKESTHNDISESEHLPSTAEVEETSEPTNTNAHQQEHGEEQDTYKTASGSSEQTTKTPKEKAHDHVNRACNLLQDAHDIFDLEERPFEDECSLATEHINNASEAILHVPKELELTPTSNAKAHYELGEKRMYFSNEAKKVIDSISDFIQPTSVKHQKNIQDKIGLLQQILEDIDSLIGHFSSCTD